MRGSTVLLCGLFLMAMPTLLDTQLLAADSKAEGSTEPGSTAGRPNRGYVTRFDLATREDLRFARQLRVLFPGDRVQDWPILEDLVKQVGDYAAKYLDAQTIAHAISTGMSLEGQPPLRRLKELVDSCAATLGMDVPEVFVRNCPITTAYVGKAGNRTTLVLTSGLLGLYEGCDDELRFIIGHELGHAKCDHIRMKRAAYGILVAIQKIDQYAVPDKYQRVLPTLAAGRLFQWCRESEISADRAGLLCCGDPKTAYSALQRLLHGVPPDSRWVDPDSPEFDADAAVAQFHRWQDEPFVQFVIYVKRFSAEAPFVPERLAALKQWADTGRHREILTRKAPLDTGQLVTIQTIALANLAPEDEPVDVYVTAYDESDEKLFVTTTASDMASVTWRKIDSTHGCMNGQPIFFEIWQDNYWRDALLGGFVVYPIKDQKTHLVPILWDWKERSDIARAGTARVDLEFHKRP